MRLRCVLAIAAVPWVVAAQGSGSAPVVLPAAAAAQLARSLEASTAHPRHVWRNTPPLDTLSRVAAYVEIPRGERTKWEFDMQRNARAVDRVIPESVGGYPVNYGFVPQTVSYDGDPFDALVLGPPLDGGALVHGVIVGLMHMEDEKGLDSKAVLSTVDGAGMPVHQLTDADRREIGSFFDRYKRGQPGAFSKVFGWGTQAEAMTFIKTTHAFFFQCRRSVAAPCRIAPLN